METPEHQAKTVGVGTIFIVSRRTIKDILTEEWLVCISMFHLGLMLMMGGELLKNEIQEHNQDGVEISL